MSYSSEVLADNPLFYYRLDEYQGTVLRDELGLSPGTLTASGITYSQPSAGPALNTALAFSGTGSGGNGPTIDLSPYPAITLEWWMSTAAWSVVRVIFEQTNNFTTTAGAFAIAVESGPLLNIEMFAGGANFNIGECRVPPLNVFHHFVVIMRTGITGTGASSMYIDTVPQVMTTRSTYTTAITAFATGTISIMSRAGGGSNQQAGTTDEIAMYGSELSPGRIAAHYAAKNWPTIVSTPSAQRRPRKTSW